MQHTTNGGRRRLGRRWFGLLALVAVIGLAVPALLKATRREPRVAAGPIALAVADFVTLFAYFNLGRWLAT